MAHSNLVFSGSPAGAWEPGLNSTPDPNPYAALLMPNLWYTPVSLSRRPAEGTDGCRTPEGEPGHGLPQPRGSRAKLSLLSLTGGYYGVRRRLAKMRLHRLPVWLWLQYEAGMHPFIFLIAVIVIISAWVLYKTEVRSK